MTRQRIWQLKMKAEGRCTICGQPAQKTRCELHLKQARANSNRRRQNGG